MNISKKFILLIFLLFSSTFISCSYDLHFSGISENSVNEILQNYQNKNYSKEDVINIIGKPSSTSLFDENTWFYMQRELENKSFLTLGKQKITTNNVLEINFNDYGIVVSKKIYSLKDMNEVKIDKDKTENMAIKKTGINSLFQSIYQKINAPKNNRKRN